MITGFIEFFRDIHVIELHSANTTAGPGADSEVLFDISTTSSEARSRRLLVVLKGSGNNKVTWKIQGAGMRGDLDIIVSILIPSIFNIPQYCLHLK